MNWITGHLSHGPIGWGILLSIGVLVLFSLSSVAIMIERGLALKRIGAEEETEFRALRDLLMRGEFQQAKKRAAASLAPCAVALSAGLSHGDIASETVKEAALQEASMQSNYLMHRLPVLGTVASTAPYVGLFGTVLGILDAFNRIANSGQMGAKVVAAPIAEALTATAIGLGVAIPAVMAYNFFSNKVNDLSAHVENHTLDLVARLPKTEAVEVVR